MKLKDVLSSISKNKSNGQYSACIKKGKLKEAGISKEELLDMNIDTKLKKLLYDD